MRLPPWLTKRMPPPYVMEEMEKLIKNLSLHTVCQEAHCPNIGDCFSRKTATFMILGNCCTRNCSFCAVKKGTPSPPDPEEPENVAKAVSKLKLNYVVITSPTRDDLPDGGAEQFARVISSIRKLCGKKTYIEVLIPDLAGSFSSLQKILKAKPFVLNHNLETVPRLYPQVRPGADYRRSLKLLERCKRVDPGIYTKSGLMVGLGETKDEIIGVMKDLRSIGCDILTIGQYLRPSSRHLGVKEFISPVVFDYYREIASSLGFLHIASSPFVRSSYMARDWLTQ
jgi:lipoic acid synthetase